MGFRALGLRLRIVFKLQVCSAGLGFEIGGSGFRAVGFEVAVSGLRFGPTLDADDTNQYAIEYGIGSSRILGNTVDGQNPALPIVRNIP